MSLPAISVIWLVEVCLAALNGNITIGDSNTTHGPFHTLVLSAGGEEGGVSVTAQEGNTDFILVWVICIFGRISCIDETIRRSRESHSNRRSYNTVLS